VHHIIFAFCLSDILLFLLYKIQIQILAGFSARNAHKLGVFQRQYYDDLAASAGTKSVAPVVTKLHTECAGARFSDLYGFRDRRFKIIDEENYIELK
jgi:hypothetical protein